MMCGNARPQRRDPARHPARPRLATNHSKQTGAIMASDKRKQSLYFPDEYLDEIRAESLRQDRSMSWLVQKAWEIARDSIKSFPSANDYIPGEQVQEDERGAEE